jgi:UDP-N-acetylmuramoyl-L-alanyl-D-glutamate--2,6-diaminopimelate ligase
LEEMTNGLKLRADSEIILDRRIAIRRAMEIAQPSDLVIVLGKGHEIGQEVNGKKIPFNDREEILQAAGIA